MSGAIKLIDINGQTHTARFIFELLLAKSKYLKFVLELAELIVRMPIWGLYE